MIITRTIEETRKHIDRWRSKGETIGFVPTMGSLHDGHESLIVKSVEDNDKTVVSVFVNPKQFSANEDLATYPQNFEADCVVCENAKADLIFYPRGNEMYSKDFSTYVNMSGTSLTQTLCARSRPTHFEGVCTVVLKLFNIVNADRAYFGQKDAQQLEIVKRMVRDLNLTVEIVACPIVRELDGLAMSSRNSYLSEKERQAALSLSKSLFAAEKLIKKGERNIDKIIDAMQEIISAEELAEIDYIEILDADNLSPLGEIKLPFIIALAVFIGKTRLIDNYIQIDKSPLKPYGSWRF
ncbi:MAG: pantoate--beta-alanine ligase [Turicibacter sp.]|nr:pantoate--beta-alanine ligase [Turicibacter sp.]